jgi:hypothetical protein
MRYIVLTAVSVLVISAGALAQTTDPIEKALLAAPGNLRKDATVIRWKADQTYDTLKQGTSRLVCYDRTGFPLERPWSVECTSVANLPRVAQNMKFAAEAAGDENKMKALIAAADKNGTRVKAEMGSIWYNFRGTSQEMATRHTTVAMPGISGKDVGLPETRDQGGAWVMFAGTSEAHIMVPGR